MILVSYCRFLRKNSKVKENVSITRPRDSFQVTVFDFNNFVDFCILFPGWDLNDSSC